MLRVLQVIGTMNHGGGAQAMLMNYYRNIDRSQIQFDFVVHTKGRDTFEDEIERLGGKVFHTNLKYNLLNLPSYLSWWRKFLREHPEYTVIHGHIGSSAAVYLGEAKRQGRYAIAHSHGTKETTDSIMHRTVWKICSYPTRFIADHYFACSEEAGRDRFGKRITGTDKFEVLLNAIDCDKFIFSEKKRELIREQYGLKDAYVVGHVGRFSPPKKHDRLIAIFDCLHRKVSNSKLLMLGDGPLREVIKNKCHEKGLDDAVIFAGIHDNVEDYYSAMDVFCFPSAWEGLGMVAVEAQVAGLPCVASDAVPGKADIGAGLFSAISLEKTDAEWAEKLVVSRDMPRMTDTIGFARKAGYDVKTAVEDLKRFYLDIQIEAL